MSFVSVLIGSKDRQSSLIRCVSSIVSQTYQNLEIVILDDNSNKKLSHQITQEFDDPRIRCIRSNVSLGVAAGRNKLIKVSSGDYVIVLDDDARFRDNHSVAKVVGLLDRYNDVGLLAFKIIDIIRDEEKRVRAPFSRNVIKRNPEIVNTPNYISYYIGAGHGIRREVFKKCGLYPENFFYGGEEADLSYRMLDQGYKLLYAPEIVVEHFPQFSEPYMRTSSSEYAYFIIRNRIWINYKYLPWFPSLANSIIWSLSLLLTSILRGGVLRFIKGLKDGITGTRMLQRKPIKESTVVYLKNNYGRLFR
jgi:GT2 family glycosyltransferase